MARTITSATISAATTSSASASTFVTWEGLCEEIHGLETYFDSLVTKLFVDAGVVDPDSMKIKTAVPGWKVQVTAKNIRSIITEGVRGMWDATSRSGTLTLFGTDITVSEKEAACIQAAVLGSKKFGTSSILFNNYFVSECRRRHSEYMSASGKGDWVAYQKKEGGGEVTQKLNLPTTLPKKEVQAKA